MFLKVIMEHLIKSMQWRYAVKKFDANKKVDETLFQELLTITNLAATSYGLQPYRMIVVRNPETRQALQNASYGQSQIVDASHLIVFTACTHVDEQYIHDYISLVARTRGAEISSLDAYKNNLLRTVQNTPQEKAVIWHSKQAYIAVGTLLSACAVYQVDACPMEGIVAAQYDEILGLKEKNLTTLCVVTVGYRSSEDKYQHLAKVRRPLSDMVIDM
jgi:nitroreductase